MIGTLRHARLAQKHSERINMYAWEKVGEKINRNWRVLGVGSTRNALLHIPSGVVYKVARWDHYSHTNTHEADISARLAGVHRVKRFTHDIVIPEVTAHKVSATNTVVAMNFYEGGNWDTPCPPRSMMDRFEKSGWWDLFEINIAKIDTGWVVIDMGAFDTDARPLDSFIPM